MDAKETPSWQYWPDDPHFSSFLAGIFVGQAFLVACVLVLVYLFLLREPTKGARKPLAPGVVRTAGRQSTPFTAKTSGQLASDASLLESCEWLNAIVARVWGELRQSDALVAFLTHAVDEAFNPPGKPSFVGHIVVRDLSIGEVLPTIDGVSISVGGSNGDKPSDMELSVFFDVSYNGPLSLAIDTELVLNWPAQRLAALPISLAVSLLGFGGKFRLHCPHPTDGAPTAFSLALLAEPSVSLEVSSSLGAASKVRDLPKLRDILTSRLYEGIARALVSPSCISIPAIEGVLNVLRQASRNEANGESQKGSASQESNPGSSALGGKEGAVIGLVDTESPLRQRWMGRVTPLTRGSAHAPAQ
eukprot:Opistho-2@30556